MTTVELRNVSNKILHNVNIYVPSGCFYVLIGPNGAGKTTLLKTIAGLIEYTGTILFDGEPIDDLPPEKRCVGYMPQSIALFPHMTVEENIMFGPRVKGYSVSEARAIARELMDFLGISHLARKYPLKLSGGEKKKVALARALAVNPKVLLLDEPFTGIQYDQKVEIALMLKKLSVKYKKTIILVTHDIDEALGLGESFGVIKNGRILYTGSRGEFIESIDNLLEYINAFECIISKRLTEDLVYMDCNGLQLLAPLENKAITKKARILIPADKIYVAATPAWHGMNTFKAKIIAVKKIFGNIVEVKVIINNNTYTLKLTRSILLKPGNEVYIKIPIRYLHVETT
ncbi:ABC transporter ATP-binding protein [Desulfurococcaceae archaeon MEX13E-LK6-19]|nr:ABC transporter ATP-binding protein [Desulfurococcaceae archaeon MEX13E-LK6-19]